MEKPIWITLPLVVLAFVVIVRAVLRRPIPRYDLNVVVSLFLFVYLLITASLGLFWVARMDLPVFDLHYLFGYCVLILMAAHVWFQLPIINAWLRKQSPTILLEANGKRWRRSVRIAARSIAVAVLLLIAGVIVYEFLRPQPTFILDDEDRPIGARNTSPAENRFTTGSTVARWSGQPVVNEIRRWLSIMLPILFTENQQATEAPRRIWLSHRGQRMSGAQYIHEATGISRWGVFRAPRLVGSQPDEYKSFPTKPVIALPPPRKQSGKSFTEVVGLEHDARLRLAESRLPRWQTGQPTLTKQTLSDLLHYAYGVTERRRYPGGTIFLRAAASAGALYPTDLYVAIRNVEGMSSGIYYYHAANHDLTQTGSREELDRLALASAYHGWLVNSPVAFILTVVYDRTVWKYRDRSYRYVLLDAAHVAGNLTLAATALGMPYQLVGLFDDRGVSEALTLNAADEGVVLIIALGNHTKTQETRVPAFDLPILPKPVDEMELARLSHALTSVRWKAGSLPLSSIRFEKVPGRATRQTYTMPASSTGRRDLFEVIQTRRSFREFARREVRFEDLAGIIRESYPWHNQPALAEGGHWSHLYLVVRAVTTLPAGVYVYNPESDKLELVVRAEFSRKIASAGLSQELLERAAVVFVWTIDQSRVGTLQGERDYRYGCIEIGLSGERAYLAAGARGLGACGVGAFYDDEVEELLQVRNSDRRAKYLMGIGQMR